TAAIAAKPMKNRNRIIGLPPRLQLTVLRPPRLLLLLQLLFCIRQKLVEPFRKPIGIDEWIRLSRLPYRELLAALKGLEGIRMIRDRHLGSSAQSHDALDAVDVRLRRLDSAEILTVATEEERF